MCQVPLMTGTVLAEAPRRLVMTFADPGGSPPEGLSRVRLSSTRIRKRHQDTDGWPKCCPAYWRR
jgi:hypothetical protein